MCAEAADDAHHLQREVVWQRRVIAELGARLDGARHRIDELDESRRHELRRRIRAEEELAATRRRVGMILIEPLARWLARRPRLHRMMLGPLKARLARRELRGLRRRSHP